MAGVTIGETSIRRLFAFEHHVCHPSAADGATIATVIALRHLWRVSLAPILFVATACEAPAAPRPSTPSTPMTLEPIVVTAPLPSAPQPTATSIESAPSDPDAGSRPVQNLDAIIRGGLHPKARDCYNAALREDPNQQGRVVITIHVMPTGDVDAASAAQCTGLRPAACDCMATAARQLHFQPPGGDGSTINAPMNFVKRERVTRVAAHAEAAIYRDVRPAASGCYAAALRTNATVSGDATYYLRINADGRVASLSADPDAQLPRDFLECVANAFRTATFPPSIELRVPLQFRAAVL